MGLTDPGGLDSWRGPQARVLRGDKNKGRRTSPGGALHLVRAAVQAPQLLRLDAWPEEGGPGVEREQGG